MKKLNIFLALIVSFIYYVPANAQEVTVDNSVISIPSGTFMTTDGGITTQSSGGIDNSGNVELKGDWTNNASGLINGSNGTVQFNGTGSQVIGGTSSTDFYNLDVTNTGGVSLQQAESVTNQLTLNSHLRLGNNNLILSAGAAAVAGTLGAASGMVVCNGSGMMRKLYSANGSYLYPLGDITGTPEYSPLQLNFTSGAYAGGAYAEATTVNAKHPNNGSNTNWLNRYWNVSASNITSFNCNLLGNYPVADIAGTETSISSARLTGTFNQFTNPWVKYQAFTGAHTLVANNVTQFSSFTGITLANPSVSISGPSSKCTGQPAVTLTANPVGDAVFAYQWSTGAATSTISVNPAVNTNYTVTVTDANGFIAVSPSFTVTVNTSPAATISNNGNNDICLSQPASVHLVFGGTGPWNYTVSNGTQNISGSSSVTPKDINIIPVTAGTHNYTITVFSDAFCSGTSTGTAVVIVSSTGPTTSVGTLTTPGEACNGTVSLITVNPVGGQNIHYSWNTGTNSSVVLYSNNIGGPFSAGPFSTATNQVYARFGALAGGSGYNICVQGVNACGSTINKCTWIRGVVSVPGTITPASGVVACPNDVKNYACGASAGASVYNWTLAGSATPITSGQGTDNVTVTFPPAFTSGQLCVTASLTCGGSSTSAPRCMTVSKTPTVPGSMTGPSNICPGATGVIFSVPAVTGASGYSWTTPAGTTITSGQNTTSITVNFPNPYTGAPPVCVTATSSCASSVARCKTVGSNIPPAPGSVTGPTSNICNSTVQYSIPNIANASSYAWTNPAGTTITSGQGSTTILLAVSPAFVSGQLSVSASTLACTPGTGPARTITIIGKPNTPGTITANPALWCTGGFVNFSVATVSPLPTFNWTVSNGTITAGQGSNNIDVTWGATAAGTVNVNASSGCGTSSIRSQNFSSGCREEDNQPTTGSWKLAVYPNPAHEKLTVSIDVSEDSDFLLQLMDVSGRVLLSEAHYAQPGFNDYDLDLKNLPKGFYMLEVQSVKGAAGSWMTKVVVE